MLLFTKIKAGYFNCPERTERYFLHFSVDFNVIENDSSGILLLLSGVGEKFLAKIEIVVKEKMKDLAGFHLLHSGCVCFCNFDYSLKITLLSLKVSPVFFFANKDGKIDLIPDERV